MRHFSSAPFCILRGKILTWSDGIFSGVFEKMGAERGVFVDKLWWIAWQRWVAKWRFWRFDFFAFFQDLFSRAD
jgi:hypothetical protein